MKRKYGSRYDWKRVTERAYTEYFMENDPAFKGYVTLLHMKSVNKPLVMTYEGRTVCIADKGYLWMQHFPVDEHYSITTVYDSSHHIVQFYIDICKENGYCPVNGPWMDDLYVDLIVLPTGEMIEKDKDELEVAYQNHELSLMDFELASTEFERIKTRVSNGFLELCTMTNEHFIILIQQFK